MRKLFLFSMLLLIFIVVSTEIVQANLNDGLVAYYPFNGNANDESGDGNNGEEYGGIAYEDGVIGKALLLDGSMDEYILAPNSESLSITNSISICSWVRSTVFDFSINPIVTMGYANEDYTLWLRPDGLSLLLNSQQFWQSYTSESIDLNTWYFVVATYDLQKVKYYINGEFKAEYDFNRLISTSGESLYIGSSYPGGNEYFKGYIDELSIYNRALSKPEILELYTVTEAVQDQCMVADRVIIINNEEVQATFHADITDPDGIVDIQSVLLNMSDINSGSGNINMSLVDADTGGYEAVITIPADTAARLYPVPVTAIDNSGFKDIKIIEFEVKKKITATISPSQTLTDAFDNQIDMQSLEISIQFNETVQQRQGANILRAGEDCYVEVRVYNPDGEFHETYQVYGFLDIVIDSAMEGQWTYETINYCAESIDVEIETRGSNTGILTGTVKNFWL